MLLDSISIVKLQKLPPEFQSATQEPNLLAYNHHEILVAFAGKEFIGSVRSALRPEVKNCGLVTDLLVDDKHKNKGIEEKLLSSSEEILKELKVEEVDGVCLDGIGLVRYFYRSGYKPFRRTVFVEWDLTQSFNLDISDEYLLEEHLGGGRTDSSEVEEVVLNSLQPYWTPWKEKTDIRNQELRIKNQVKEFFKDKTYRVFVAYQKGKAVGLVDARGSTPNLVFGVAIRKDFKGRKLGSALLNHSLNYLRNLELKKALTISTSGLDDYDPQIYLYTISGGKIVKEYLDLRKQL